MHHSPAMLDLDRVYRLALHSKSGAGLDAEEAGWRLSIVMSAADYLIPYHQNLAEITDTGNFERCS